MKTGKQNKNKYVFSFGSRKTESKSKDKTLLGGKGLHLHEMTQLGLPVPPGFTISTQVCQFYYENNQSYPRSLKAQIQLGLKKLEKEMKRKFGDPKNPLLVSVRSGARDSMPGMMDTILNLGLNDITIQGLIKQSQNKRFAFDSYRRLVSMYGDVVLNIPSSQFESVLEDFKYNRHVTLDTDLSAEDLEELVKKFKQIIRIHGKIFPENTMDQLWGAMSAVFKSWMNARAVTYRKLNSIPEHWGTAVNIQSMVFGNRGEDSATGVAFTRDPSTGEKKFFGEYLINAQGEDVVAGIRTPLPINATSSFCSTKGGSETKKITLEKVMPTVYKQLLKLYQKLEKHYRDMQDIEFTIECGKLYLLQTRSGKRTATAALKIAVDMVQENLISKKEAILSIQPEQLHQLLHPCLDPSAPKKVLTKGLPASPGAATGQIVFDSQTAEKWVKDFGRKVILIRLETSPEDIQGMALAEGILTARGGMTSHAAVVARGMGKCCISGCHSIKINEEKKEITFGLSSTTAITGPLREGDFITLDGNTGEIILGEVRTLTPVLNKNFKKVMSWTNDFKKMYVKTNADTPSDALVARQFGAEGIGLCRTEHMFFESDRIDAVREMILSDNIKDRKKALEKILPMQKADFKAIFKEMKGYPVTIRLLDPPLHEFIPKIDDEIQLLSKKMNIHFDQLKKKIESLHEFNPMLGHRGCRLGISFPEIYRTQVRAILQAAYELYQEEKIMVEPEIMIPLVGDAKELAFIEAYCHEEAQITFEQAQTKGKKPYKVKYKIGTMIEIPRAALTAGEIAKHATFFSFGTNDLTQTTYGLSRDDSSSFLKDYFDAHIYEKDPFSSLDENGVGKLMRIAVEEGRATRSDLKIGICGEHGGDPESIFLCQKIGLDYISCSPYRVPIARLAAAQAVLQEK